MPSTSRMIDDCLNVIDIPESNGGPGFNSWEKEFIENIADWLDSGRPLTERQESTLKRLWDRI